MIKNLIYILSTISLKTYAQDVSKKDYAKIYSNKYDGCFILYDVKEQKTVLKYEQNGSCDKRSAPNKQMRG